MVRKGIASMSQNNIASWETRSSSKLRQGNLSQNVYVTPIEQKLIPNQISADLSKVKSYKEQRNNFLSCSLNSRPPVYFIGPSLLDSKNVVFGVFVYLHKLDNENDMRTILSNKATGCQNGIQQRGLSLYINAWETNNRILYAEFGNDRSGCHKVDSGLVTVESEKWYHIAIALVGPLTELYIDGKLVGTLDGEAHEVQLSRPILLGQYDETSFPLWGNLSHFAAARVTSSSETADVIGHMIALGEVAHASVEGLFAHFPLSDTAAGSRTLDTVSGLAATYTFPSPQSLTQGAASLRDGSAKETITAEQRAESDRLGRLRREEVRGGMRHAWGGYKKHAWGRDELKPVSRGGVDNWGSIGVTLVDSLDTLWVMGMMEEFEEATEWVRKSLSFAKGGSLSVFETTIRELGGLLSAYDLSGEQIFLEKAEDLGRRLLAAFNTASGIPMAQIDLKSGKASGGWAGGSAILSELGTLQIENRYLSYVTGKDIYEKKSMRALQLMHSKKPPHGLFPIKVSTANGDFIDHTVTFGALGDSFYEYLLKVWLQGGKKEAWLREMYDDAMDGVMDVLLKTSSPSGYSFLSDWDGKKNKLKMDHLACFMPGVLALGAHNDPLGEDSPRAKRDLAVAKALMFTCREMYRRTPTGISPEFVEFRAGIDIVTKTSAPFYILRPETAESLFVMQQLTGDPIYREWAYEIWKAIDKHCRTAVGYGALRDVNFVGSGVDDRMESFFLAETLKYLYLAQDPDTEIRLDKYVFNTEAHPTKIFDAAKHTPISV